MFAPRSPDELTLAAGCARARADRLLDRAAAGIRSADSSAQRARDAQRRDVSRTRRNDRCRLSRPVQRAARELSEPSRSSSARRPDRADGRRAGFAGALRGRRGAAADASAATADLVHRHRRAERSALNVYIVGSGAVGTYLGDLLRGVGVEVDVRAARARRRDAATMPTSRSSRRRPTTPTARSRRCAQRSRIPRNASSSRRRTASATKRSWRPRSAPTRSSRRR